ncbi:MAG: YdeI/OmpD-associated family protein [Anaerolineae bacterium]|jgi:bifunctional DNA-binding transcriptional regulator/antitoxin component of YhaV-PrlF toxin-antitoxin module
MKQQFTAEIKKHEGMDAAYVEIPFDVEEVFGTRRVKVRAWFEGVEYRGSIVRMGDCYMIGIPQAIRRQIGKSFGDTIDVIVEKDEDERVVELPDDLKRALEQNPAAKARYARLSYSHQREYVRWINDAKRPETRVRRIDKMVQMLVEDSTR